MSGNNFIIKSLKINNDAFAKQIYQDCFEEYRFMVNEIICAQLLTIEQESKYDFSSSPLDYKFSSSRNIKKNLKND
jgi:hypothetical protein